MTEIRLRPTGKKVRLDRDVDVESLFIGRGPDNDLSLKGLTISLHQATLRMADGRLYVEAAPGQEVNVNGLVTTGERIGPGDILKIGAWEVRIALPEADADVDVAQDDPDGGGQEGGPGHDDVDGARGARVHAHRPSHVGWQHRADLGHVHLHVLEGERRVCDLVLVHVHILQELVQPLRDQVGRVRPQRGREGAPHRRRHRPAGG